MDENLHSPQFFFKMMTLADCPCDKWLFFIFRKLEMFVKIISSVITDFTLKIDLCFTFKFIQIRRLLQESARKALNTHWCWKERLKEILLRKEVTKVILEG